MAQSLAGLFGLSERTGYETFYGFKEAAFAPVADPKFLYPSASHEAALDQLLEAVRSHQRSVLLVGDEGAGKTLLCRVVAGRLGDRVLASFVAEPPASPDDLLRKLLTDFGIISSGDMARGRLVHATSAELTSTLASFLALLGPLQMSATAIIDNVHRLTPAVLEQIRVLAESGGDQPALQLILTADVSFLESLATPTLASFDAHIARKILIEPLEADEVSGYVRHRMDVAGSPGRLQFEDAASTRLFELSGGVPAVINRVCDRALTLGHDASASVIDDAMVDRAAHDLEIAPPQSDVARFAGLAVALVTVVALMLVGAAGAATVFRDRLTSFIAGWQAPPAPPPPPTLLVPASIELPLVENETSLP